jgi:multidrug efflux pump subunit AcrA (membrane-fusion protein)
MKPVTFTLVVFLLLILSACSGQSVTSPPDLLTIKSQSLSNTLFYTGTIQPLKTVVVPSPADGVIVDAPFQYGEEVEAGKLLFAISSSKFLTDYKTALMQYI